jgi:putative RNA 2'-phosphotransferase
MSRKSTSKFLALILRHDPGQAGLTLDPHGWVRVRDLCAALAERGQRLDLELIENIIGSSDKVRFELSPDKKYIRALHGHSVELVLDHQPATPPVVLYHGTVRSFLEPIAEHGLVPGSRQFVHLATTTADAAEVARRRGRPVVLVVDAARMAHDGHEFFHTASGVWLTATVAPTYLTFPEAA